MEESEKRTLAKTISWRTTATLATMVIIHIFTGKVSLSVGVGLVEVASKMLLYYLHERASGKIAWGEPALSRIRLAEEMEEGNFEKVKELLRDLGYM